MAYNDPAMANAAVPYLFNPQGQLVIADPQAMMNFMPPETGGPPNPYMQFQLTQPPGQQPLAPPMGTNLEIKGEPPAAPEAPPAPAGGGTGGGAGGGKNEEKKKAAYGMTAQQAQALSQLMSGSAGPARQAPGAGVVAPRGLTGNMQQYQMGQVGARPTLGALLNAYRAR